MLAVPGKKFQQVIKLARAGLHPVAIAHHVGGSPQTVRVLVHKARRRGLDVGPELVRVNVHISKGQRAQMDIVAVERGISRSELASKLMAAIINSDLFSAVLDN